MTDEQQLTAAGNEMSASFLAAKKRSDETLAKLEAKPSSFTMLTGDRPTGRLHLGHYFGSIRERVAMQERGVNTNIIIADYQVITDRYFQLLEASIRRQPECYLWTHNRWKRSHEEYNLRLDPTTGIVNLTDSVEELRRKRNAATAQDNNPQ